MESDNDLVKRLSDIEPLIARMENLKAARHYWQEKILFIAKNIAMTETMGSYIDVIDGRDCIMSVCRSDRQEYIDSFVGNLKQAAHSLIMEELSS